MSDTIEYALFANDVLLRAPANMSAQNTGNLLESCQKLLKESGKERIFVDLSGCQYLDSTIMGQLVGLHKAMRPGNLVLCTPSPEARQILLIMGLDKMLTISEETMEQELDFLPFINEKKNGPIEILSAHQTLSKLSPDNARRFELLISTLNNAKK